jgi:hypothetical protein
MPERNCSELPEKVKTNPQVGIFAFFYWSKLAAKRAKKLTFLIFT